MEQKDGEAELKTSPERQERPRRKRGRPKRLEAEKRADTREDVNVPGSQGSDVRHENDFRGSE